MKSNWRPSTFALSQLLHFFVACAFVFGAFSIRQPWYYGVVSILLISAIKETTFDIWIEDDSYRDGIVDWLFYGFGCLVASSIILLQNHL